MQLQPEWVLFKKQSEKWIGMLYSLVIGAKKIFHELTSLLACSKFEWCIH